MATEGKVKVRIEGDDVHLSKTLDNVEKKTTKMDSILQGVGQHIGEALTGGAVQGAQMLVGTIDKASDFNETISKSGVIFGQELVPELTKWAESGAKAFGQSKQQALDAATTFAVFGKSAGLAGDDLADFAKSNTQLASDLASFHNTSPEDAIQAIGAAMRGESEPMRRYGVLLDDASMRQEALKMGLITTTKDALTPQQKVLAAQSLMMKQTADAQGDFARTSDGLANSSRALDAQWENMQVTIGQKLLPVKMALVGFMVNNLLPALQVMGEWVQRVASFLGEHKEILLAVGIVIMVAFVPALVAWAAGALAAAAATIAAAAPVIALGIVIGALVAGVIYAYQHWGWFRQAVDAVGEALKIIADVIVQVVGAAIDVGIWYVKQYWHAFELARDVAKEVVDKIVGFFQGLASGIGNVIGTVKDAIVGPFKAAFNAIAELWNNTVGRISFNVPGWVPGIGGKGFDVPDIPTFAEGGLAFSPMLAVVGDHTSGGAEIISPEAKMRQIFREEAGAGAGVSIGTVNVHNGDYGSLTREIDFTWRVNRGRAAA